MEPTSEKLVSTTQKAELLRPTLIVVISVVIGTLLAKTLLAPVASKPKSVNVTFPEDVPLKTWQIAEIAPVTLATDTRSHDGQTARVLSNAPSGEVVEAYQYRYQSEKTTRHDNSSQLIVSAYYLTSTDGDLKPFISEKTGQVGTATKQDAVHGFYAVFTHQGSAHVTSCLNPRSPATVTSDQFSRNRLIYDTRLSRLVPWLRGQQTLPDERCLWTQLSVPLEQYASEATAKKAAEMAWMDWASWWRAAL